MKGKKKVKWTILIILLALVLATAGSTMAAPPIQEPESIACGDSITCSTAGNAVYVENAGTGATIYGHNTSTGDGLKGRGNPGVYGFSYHAAGVRGKSNAGVGVKGESVSKYGVFATSVDSAGLWAQSSGGWGGYLRGGTGGADLVLGGWDTAHDDGNLWSEPDYPSSDLNLFSNHVVAIHLDKNNDEDGRFLVYNGANQIALELSEAGNLKLREDIFLDSDGAGSGGAILATAVAGHDLALHANDNIYADLDDDNDSDSCFIIRDGADAFLWTQCGGKGTTTTGAAAVAVETGSGPRKMYAMSSPGLWFEDFGSAALVDGQATVEIDPLFAEVSNLDAGYQVYLTSVSSDLVILVVTAKTPTTFEVRGATLDGEPVAAGFDYRIVAKRAGYEDYRLEVAESMLDGGQ